MKLIALTITLCMALGSTAMAQKNRQNRNLKKDDRKRLEKQAKEKDRAPNDFERGQKKKDKEEAQDVKKRVKEDKREGKGPKAFLPNTERNQNPLVIGKTYFLNADTIRRFALPLVPQTEG